MNWSTSCKRERERELNKHQDKLGKLGAASGKIQNSYQLTPQLGSLVFRPQFHLARDCRRPGVARLGFASGSSEPTRDALVGDARRNRDEDEDGVRLARPARELKAAVAGDGDVVAAADDEVRDH